MSAVHSKAWKDRGKATGRCRDCRNMATEGSVMCEYHLFRHRERNAKARERKRGTRIARVAFIPPPFQAQRVPSAMEFITKPYAKTIPDGNVALYAACPWLAP